MQDEHHPLGRAEPLQHDQQGQLDVVVEGDPVGRVGGRLEANRWLAAGDELDLAGVMRAFPARPGGAELIQAQPAGDHDQPAASIIDLTARRAEQAGERVLDHVLGRADVPQHPEGQVDQVRAVLIPGLDDLFVTLLLSHLRLPGKPADPA